MKTSRLLLAFSLALVALSFSACVTKTDTSGAKVTDYPATTLRIVQVAAPSIKAVTKVAARKIAAHNPTHLEEFQLSGAAVALIFNIGDPTADNFAAAIQRAVPQISAADAKDLGDILAGTWSSIEQQAANDGITLSLTTLIKDPAYKQAADLFTNSIIDGFNAGIADYSAANTP